MAEKVYGMFITCAKLTVQNRKLRRMDVGEKSPVDLWATKCEHCIKYGTGMKATVIRCANNMSVGG